MELLIGDVFRRAAASTPEGVAVAVDGEQLTFRELDRAANRMGRALNTMGILHRDRVAWWGDTCLDAVPLFAGLAKAGVVFAPVNARLSAEETAPVVAKARPRALVVDRGHQRSAAVAAAAAGVDVVTIDDLVV